MEKQKIFKTSYVNKLLDEVRNETSIDLYRKSEFIYEDDQTFMLPKIFYPKELYSMMRIKDDFSSAIAIYEAYEELTPLQASDPRLWCYISHVDLFYYMRQRWDGEITSKYIIDHWFIAGQSQSALMTDNLSGLWWAVFLSIDKDRSDKYELTKILLRQRDFAFRTLGRYKLGRYKEAIHAILEYILENENEFSNKFEAKTRSLTSFLNLYFGTKPLPHFKKNEIKKIIRENAHSMGLITE